jgi:hypothetical protein
MRFGMQISDKIHPIEKSASGFIYGGEKDTD